MKLDLRVGIVLEAELIEESNKLIRISVDLGEEIGRRQILAGLKETHDAETLVGMRIIVLVNLEPRKMMGFESAGMLLAAGSDAGPVLLVPNSDAPLGAPIS